MLLERFFEFWTLSDPNVVWVLVGSLLLGVSAGSVGCFAFLRNRSLVGDALAHAALPGVTTSFLIFQSRDPFLITGGALVSSLIGMVLIDFIVRNSKVSEDSALAIILSFFFAIGVFQLTIIQKLPVASQAGLDKLLFGQAASLVSKDVMVLGSIALLMILFIIVCYRPLKMISFDPVFARSMGASVKAFEIALTIALVLSVVIGLQLVGVVLMAAIVLTPAAAARYWTDDLKSMIITAGLFGAAAGVIGANVSYLAPRMPTGPWMVMGISLIFLISVLGAPKHGVVARYIRRRRLTWRIVEENILRTLFKLGEGKENAKLGVNPSTILTFRSIALHTLNAGIGRLARMGLVSKGVDGVFLTDKGFKRAEELTRFHRLWELYLTTKTSIRPDHVHLDAEEIEHILTPELEAQLIEELGGVTNDPHGKVIPSRSEEPSSGGSIT